MSLMLFLSVVSPACLLPACLLACLLPACFLALAPLSPPASFVLTAKHTKLNKNAKTKTNKQMDYNFTVVTFVTSGKDQMALATITQAYKVISSFFFADPTTELVFLS